MNILKSRILMPLVLSLTLLTLTACNGGSTDTGTNIHATTFEPNDVVIVENTNFVIIDGIKHETGGIKQAPAPVNAEVFQCKKDSTLNNNGESCLNQNIGFKTIEFDLYTTSTPRLLQIRVHLHTLTGTLVVNTTHGPGTMTLKDSNFNTIGYKKEYSNTLFFNVSEISVSATEKFLDLFLEISSGDNSHECINYHPIIPGSDGVIDEEEKARCIKHAVIENITASYR